jgi:hypothetical protein
MGRSGTSALTRVLSLCGAHLPNALLQPNYGNPTGYWEPAMALRLNDDFLYRHGANWWDPTLRLQSGEVTFGSDAKQDFIRAIQDFLDSCNGRPLVIKDPRIAAVAPFWFEAAARSGYSITCVIPVRHPQEVANSLIARDGVSLDLSNLLWLKYNLLAERESRCVPRVFVEYASFMRDWRSQVERISRSLDIDLSDRDDEVIDAFLEPSLYRNRQSSGNGTPVPQPWVEAVYAEVRAAAQDMPLNVDKMDEAFELLQTCDYASRFVRELPDVNAPSDDSHTREWGEVAYRIAELLWRTTALPQSAVSSLPSSVAPR